MQANCAATQNRDCQPCGGRSSSAGNTATSCTCDSGYALQSGDTSTTTGDCYFCTTGYTITLNVNLNCNNVK